MELFEILSWFTNYFGMLILSLFKGNYSMFVILTLVISFALFVVLHLFKSFGAYQMAKNRGFGNRWMAFVPILNTYYLGKIAGEATIINLKIKNIGLITAIIEGVVFVAMGAFYVSYFGSILICPELLTAYGDDFENAYASATQTQLNWYNAFNVLYYVQNVRYVYWFSYLLLLVILYRSYAPREIMWFTVASALIIVAAPIIIFVIRNRRYSNFEQLVKEQHQRYYEERRRYSSQGGYNNQGTHTYGNPDDDPFAEFSNKDNSQNYNNAQNNSYNQNAQNSSNTGDDDDLFS